MTPERPEPHELANYGIPSDEGEKVIYIVLGLALVLFLIGSAVLILYA
jgi:hypothetical protein